MQNAEKSSILTLMYLIYLGNIYSFYRWFIWISFNDLMTVHSASNTINLITIKYTLHFKMH